VGRLDADTTGLLLMTDEGELLHRITSPKRSIWKVYEATLAQDLSGACRASTAKH
jgi:16S rRNA pseudouridine516 synthase